MRIGSGVQSASEVFGKQQNNSKTYVAENEAFSQTSVKVYLKTDDMLFSKELTKMEKNLKKKLILTLLI